MPRTSQRLAALAISGLVLAGLTGCGARIEATTEAVVEELAALPGVTSGVAITGEPTLVSRGSSMVSLELDAGISPDELEDVLRRWAELSPSIPISNHFSASTPRGDSLNVQPRMEIEAVVEEAQTWLSLTGDVDNASLTVYSYNDLPPWSIWTIDLGEVGVDLGSAVAAIRPRLEQRGRDFDLSASGSDGLTIEIDSAVDLAPPEAFAVLADLAALTDPAVGARVLEASWSTATAPHTLDIRLSLEPPDMTSIPSNELIDSIPGSAVEAYGFRLRDTLPSPAVPVTIAVRVFESEDFLALVLP